MWWVNELLSLFLAICDRELHGSLGQAHAKDSCEVAFISSVLGEGNAREVEMSAEKYEKYY